MLGFGKGTIEVQLNKFNFSPGEVIEGTVTLKLKKPVKAKELSIRIVGEQTTTQSEGINLGGGVSIGMGTSRRTHSTGSRTTTTTIFDFKQTLDGEKEYTSGGQPLVYPFQIKIPANVLNQQSQAPKEGVLGTVIKAAQMMSGTSSKISWYLIANLDIPKSFDVSKRVQINIA